MPYIMNGSSNHKVKRLVLKERDDNQYSRCKTCDKVMVGNPAKLGGPFNYCDMCKKPLCGDCLFDGCESYKVGMATDTRSAGCYRYGITKMCVDCTNECVGCGLYLCNGCNPEFYCKGCHKWRHSCTNCNSFGTCGHKLCGLCSNRITCLPCQLSQRKKELIRIAENTVKELSVVNQRIKESDTNMAMTRYRLPQKLIVKNSRKKKLYERRIREEQAPWKKKEQLSVV